MALQTPTVSQIDANIISNLEVTLSQSVPLLPKAFIRVLSKTLAGVLILLYKYGGFVFLQMFVSTASDQETTINGQTIIPLLEWGRRIGVGDPTAATVAEFVIDVSVVNQVGSLPAGSQLVNASNGVSYITLAAVALNAAMVQVVIRASADQSGGDGSGTVGNLSIGSVTSFVSPLANIDQDAAVSSQVVTGADRETFDQYRVRVIDRFQKRPQGGALSDYELWGEEVAGIINVYPYTGVNPGEIDVFSESLVSADGIPSGAELIAVLTNINLDQDGLATRRPANAFVNSLPISRISFDVMVSGLSVNDPVTTQADIVSGLSVFFLSREPFVDGLTIPPRTDIITVNTLISLVNDIVSGANGVFATVTFQLSGAGGVIPSYTLGRGEKAKLGVVTFS